MESRNKYHNIFNKNKIEIANENLQENIFPIVHLNKHAEQLLIENFIDDFDNIDNIDIIKTSFNTIETPFNTIETPFNTIETPNKYKLSDKPQQNNHFGQIKTNHHLDEIQIVESTLDRDINGNDLDTCQFENSLIYYEKIKLKKKDID